jgi:hypothetical protein
MEAHVVHAVIHNGQVAIQEPIPDTWEGQVVKLVPLTPDDPMPDLERRLAELHGPGPMELDPEERERIAAELCELNKISVAAMNRLTETTP